MDGLSLLARLSESYPDIPVIIMTAYSTAKAEKAVSESGAVGYIEKPFAVKDLADKILEALRRQSEGGTLQTVPLDVFVQLIEMEQKTCTIRVVGKGGRRKGVLFFRDGILFDGRVDDRQGEAAAYEIFSWENVILVIQDDCALRERRILADLQAVLFEAMRRKDEAQEPPKHVFEPPPAPASQPVAATSPALTRKDLARRQLQAAMGRGPAPMDIRSDTGWDPLLHPVAQLGLALGAGALKVCYIETGGASDLIILPDDSETVVAVVSPRCARDQILQNLSS